MTALVIRGDARRLPLATGSVDLIITSPPYFALRSYRDSGEHYDGQIGSEGHPQAWLEALWVVMGECWRVLKPTGVCWVNLGDKRAGSGGHNNSGLGTGAKHMAADVMGLARRRATRRNAPDRYEQAAFGRAKSKMLLPHRFAIGCMDGLADPEGKGWIVRQDQVWSKPNGLPESVTDRTRDSHEFWFMLTKQGDYFSAVDEIREPHSVGPVAPRTPDRSEQGDRPYRMGTVAAANGSNLGLNPLGKLPSSVWSIPSEPLIIPEAVAERYDLPDHFAAFPTEWPRRLILGWSPSGVCVACGEGRRPVVAKASNGRARNDNGGAGLHSRLPGGRDDQDRGGKWAEGVETTITGYSCACPDHSAPSKPAVVLDVFGGTGTVAGVARALGRVGISVDLSADYCRLAKWRVFRSGHFSKAIGRTNREAQEVLAL